MPSAEDYCPTCEQYVSSVNGHNCDGKPLVVNQRTFKAWQMEVDRIVTSESGVSIDDLPDWDFWDGWMCGMSPKSAAAEVLLNAGYPVEGM